MNKSIFTVAQIDALLSGKGIVIKGTGASTSAITSPIEGGHYLIGSEGAYNIYTYVNGAWVNGGKWLSQTESYDNVAAAQSWAEQAASSRDEAVASAEAARQSEYNAGISASNAAGDREIARDYANKAEQAYLDTNDLYKETDYIAGRVKENAKNADASAQAALEAASYAEGFSGSAASSEAAAANSAAEAKADAVSAEASATNAESAMSSALMAADIAARNEFAAAESAAAAAKSADEAKQALILTSPGGKRFKITVDDDGMLTTAELA